MTQTRKSSKTYFIYVFVKTTVCDGYRHLVNPFPIDDKHEFIELNVLVYTW